MEDTSIDWRRLFALSFGALGVVYGDIGTSPLYSLRQALLHLPANASNIYGVLSLVFWYLVLIICCKYLLIILRADNDGEGGILALSSLLKQSLKTEGKLLVFITIVGIGLIIGDGMITPAISVLSAVEGLESISLEFSKLIIPVTLVILLLLFWLQRIGTGKIGNLFAPIILIWFATIGILGLLQIVHNPGILAAINPYYAYHFFVQEKMMALIALGGVFLCVTGGEALYADIGHFNKNSIRLAWFTVALPGLLLNYFGQGANLLAHPSAITNPFYSLSPQWFLPVLIVLATLSTIIASQAIISAVFSIIKQATLLNLIPRFKIIQTSIIEKGQIYVPLINLFLVAGTCGLVIMFKSSENLGNAYGIAVNLYMIITTILVAQVAYTVWRWHFLGMCSFVLFLIIDIANLLGNSFKFLTGGWIPLIITAAGIIIMYTWRKGFKQLRRLNYQEALSDSTIIADLNAKTIPRLPGTTLFITDPYDEMGGSLLHHLKINRILTKTVVFVSVLIENKPFTPLSEKFEILQKAEGFYLLNIHYGFAEDVHLPNILEVMTKTMTLPFQIDVKNMAFFVEIIAIEITKNRIDSLWGWQKYLFSFMLRNAVPDIQFYSLPYNKTVAIGTYFRL
ncbi:MAG: KUP/HAK/KT family potassium transporter [Proteobacteria bacterium]|nr:KUP/HAK/KT family potassium transporter [Pseudomonadota bacterium]